jgi:hypothetical protein
MENLQKRQTKKAPIKKRQIKPIPNAIPNLEQRYRIFKEINYPYMMRNVEVQKNEEDRLIDAIQKAFEIHEKTPEEIADKALLEAQYYGKSYPLYTDEDVFNTRYSKTLFDDYDDEVFFRSEPIQVPNVTREDPRIAPLINKIDTLSFNPSPARTNLIDFATETSAPYTRRGRPPKKQAAGAAAKSGKPAAKPSKEAKNIGDIIGKYVRAKPVRKEYIERKKAADLRKDLIERNIQQTQLLNVTGSRSLISSPKDIRTQFLVYDAMRNSPAIERQSLLFDTD